MVANAKINSNRWKHDITFGLLDSEILILNYTVIEGDLYINGLTLNGHDLYVYGNCYIDIGIINLNGNKLTVSGNVTSGGTLYLMADN